MSTDRKKKTVSPALLKGVPPPVPPRRPGQAGGVRAENRKERSLVLASAACELFLARGLEDVTIDDIVTAASVAKGSFYRYFDDKAALVHAIFEPVASSVRASFATCAEALAATSTPAALTAAYTALALELGQTILASPQIARLYLQECRGPGHGARAPIAALADEVRRSALVLTEAAQRYGLLRKMDASVSALAVIGATERLLFAYLTGEISAPLDAIPTDLVTLVLDGVRAPEARRPA